MTLDGKPKITDFGLAKQMEGDSQQTRTGAIMGTPSYMAPEQAWGQTHEIGPLSDQYALGAILYEMLVGRPPFQGATAIETLELARNQEPVPPTRLQPKLPTDLETICLKALQKEPGKRFPDAAAMAADLGRFLDGEPIVARPVGAPERLWRWCKRNPRVAGLAAAVLLMGIAITAGSTAFAASLKRLNGQLDKSYHDEAEAREIAQTKERAAIKARNEAIAATKAEAEAREKEKQAREKAEALVQGAFAQNKNALEAQRVLSVLLNQRLLSIQGTQGVREELINTTLTGLEATIESLEQLGKVARDKEGFALATRTLAGINQRAGLIAMEYGKYDETARYFRRMEQLAEELVAADPDGLEPQKIKGSVKATLGDFQLNQIGDGEAALKLYDQALAQRREWLAREPSDEQAKRAVANMLGAIARPFALGRPGQGSGQVSRRAGAAEPVVSRPDQSGRGPPRTRRAQRQARRPERLPWRAEDRPRAFRAGACTPPGNRRAEPRRDPGAARCAALAREARQPRADLPARPEDRPRYYQEALDGFLERLKAEPTVVLAKKDVCARALLRRHGRPSAGNRDSALVHYRACRDIREELAKDPNAKLDSQDLMLAVARTGDHKRAAEIAEAMIKLPPLDARIYFYSACGFALSADAAASSPATDSHADKFATTLTAPWTRFASPSSAAGGAPSRSRPTPISTRSAPIRSSWPCSMSSARRGREACPADTVAKFRSPPMRILVAIPHYFDTDGDSPAPSVTPRFRATRSRGSRRSRHVSQH